MSDIRVDFSNKRLVLDNGDLTLTKDNAELVQQRTYVGIRTIRGEWFADILYGIPWIANKNSLVQLLGSSGKEEIDTYIKKAILEVDEVSTISYYSSAFSRKTRSLAVKFTVLAKDGQSDTQVVSIDL